MNATARLTLNARGMAFDPSTGVSYLVSPTGLDIITHWKNGLTDSAIAVKLAAAYDVSPRKVIRDIADFRAQLRIWRLDD